MSKAVYLAMSCFQGRTQDDAWDALMPWIGPAVGVQLTPGNLPSEGFRARVEASGVPVRRHHGFSYPQYRRPLWQCSTPCFTDPERSVHPPDDGDLAVVLTAPFIFETMYPGHPLGTGPELGLAMDIGVRLAVDISHLWIQRCAGVLDDAVQRRLLDYPHIAEVHVSHNNGRTDGHLPLTAEAYLLDWARQHPAPVVWESYLHRSTPDTIHRQLNTLLDGP